MSIVYNKSKENNEKDARIANKFAKRPTPSKCGKFSIYLTNKQKLGWKISENLKNGQITKSNSGNKLLATKFKQNQPSVQYNT